MSNDNIQDYVDQSIEVRKFKNKSDQEINNFILNTLEKIFKIDKKSFDSLIFTNYKSKETYNIDLKGNIVDELRKLYWKHVEYISNYFIYEEFDIENCLFSEYKFFKLEKIKTKNQVLDVDLQDIEEICLEKYRKDFNILSLFLKLDQNITKENFLSSLKDDERISLEKKIKIKDVNFELLRKKIFSIRKEARKHLKKELYEVYDFENLSLSKQDKIIDDNKITFKNPEIRCLDEKTFKFKIYVCNKGGLAIMYKTYTAKIDDKTIEDRVLKDLNTSLDSKISSDYNKRERKHQEDQVEKIKYEKNLKKQSIDNFIESTNRSIVKHWRKKLACVIEEYPNLEIKQKENIYIHIDVILQDVLRDAVVIDSLIEDNPNLTLKEIENIFLSTWAKEIPALNKQLIEKLDKEVKSGVVDKDLYNKLEKYEDFEDVKFPIFTDTYDFNTYDTKRKLNMFFTEIDKVLVPIAKKTSKNIEEEIKKDIKGLKLNSIADVIIAKGLYRILNDIENYRKAPKLKHIFSLENQPSHTDFAINLLFRYKNTTSFLNHGSTAFLEDINHSKVLTIIRESIVKFIKSGKSKQVLLDFYINNKQIINENADVITIVADMTKDIIKELKNREIEWNKKLVSQKKKTKQIGGR